MKKVKILLTGILALTLGFGALRADEKPSFQEVKGIRGVEKCFDVEALGHYDIKISLNNKYFICRGESTAFVYDIQKGTYKFFENNFIVEYIDENNYVADNYAMIGGKKYTDYMKLRSQFVTGVEGELEAFEVDAASIDCRNVVVFTYIKMPIDGRIHSVYNDVIIDVVNAKVLDTLPHAFPEQVHGGYGNVAWGWSNDLKVLCGRTSYPKVAFSNFSPGFWDRRTQPTEVHYTGTETTGTDGTLYGSNNTGTVMVGNIDEFAAVVQYDLNTRKFGVEYIPRDLGMEIGDCWAVSETGKVVGVDQPASQDIWGRVAFIYDVRSKEKYKLKEYLWHLYGLDAEKVMPLFTCGAISDNGRILGGYSYIDAMFVPYLIELDSLPLHAGVRELTVRQKYGTQMVNVTWKQPIIGSYYEEKDGEYIRHAYEISGYNVYRDGEKVNTELISTGTFAYSDVDVPEGDHKYYVEVIYTDNEKVGCDEKEIYTIEPGGCLPIQKVEANVVYNEKVNLKWGLPSANLNGAKHAKKSAKVEREANNLFAKTAEKREAKSYQSTDEDLDKVEIISTPTMSYSNLFRAGDYYYMPAYIGSQFNVFDKNMNLIKTIPGVEGMSRAYDLTVHQEGDEITIYVVSRHREIFQLRLNLTDPFEIALSNYITTELKEAVNIAYVEDPAGDYLLVGDWESFITHDATTLQKVNKEVKVDISGRAISGTEYHKGILYCSDQEALNGATILAFDYKTGELLHQTDLFADPELFEICYQDYGSSGGLVKNTLEDGTVVLDAMVQPYYQNNQNVTVEIESAPSVVGYNVYRNGVEVAKNLKKRHFTENLSDTGTYKYTVRYVSEKCGSNSKDTAKVIINKKGICVAPIDEKVWESNHMNCLSWDIPNRNGQTRLVGFNIYRNGQLLEEDLIDYKYRDDDVKKGVEYVYKIEAHFNDACRASKTVKITPSFEGKAMPPSAVRAVAQGKTEAEISWHQPFFEDPMAMGYCGLPAGGNSFANYTMLCALIGWTADQMDIFKDLYLVGMEVVFDGSFTTMHSLVYVDDELVYKKPISQKIKPRDWTTIYFDQPFAMVQKQEIAVGYEITFPASNSYSTFCFDVGPGKHGYSDLVSLDGVAYYSLYNLTSQQLDVNLCINALVVCQRDLEAAKKSSNPKEFLKSRAQRMPNVIKPTPLSGETKIFDKQAKSTSESLTLQGFNVYRDGQKLNDQLLTSFDYDDSGLVYQQEYEYEVSAVYKEGQEIKCAPVLLQAGVGVEELKAICGVSIYPNPTNGTVYINGDYTKLTVIDLGGRLVKETAGDKTVSLAGEPNGIYFFRFTAPNGKSAVVKVIKR